MDFKMYVINLIIGNFVKNFSLNIMFETCIAICKSMPASGCYRVFIPLYA